MITVAMAAVAPSIYMYVCMVVCVCVCIHANTRSTICTTSTFKSAKVSFYTILHPPPLITTYIPTSSTYIRALALNTLPFPLLCLLSLFFFHFFLFVIPALVSRLYFILLYHFAFFISLFPIGVSIMVVQLSQFGTVSATRIWLGGDEWDKIYDQFKSPLFRNIVNV